MQLLLHSTEYTMESEYERILRSKDPTSELHSIKPNIDYDPSIDYKDFNIKK